MFRISRARVSRALVAVLASALLATTATGLASAATAGSRPVPCANSGVPAGHCPGPSGSTSASAP